MARPLKRFVRRRRGEEPGAFQQNGRDRDGHADEHTQRDFPRERAQVQIPGTGGDGEEDDDEWQRQPVVDARLHVEQMPQPRRDLVVADQSGREYRVGRGENGSDKQ